MSENRKSVLFPINFHERMKIEAAIHAKEISEWIQLKCSGDLQAKIEFLENKILKQSVDIVAKDAALKILKMRIVALENKLRKSCK